MQDIDQRLKVIADHFGFKAQAEKTIEELAELIVAIKHLGRGRCPITEFVDFIEELADVKIMVDQLTYLCSSAGEDIDDEIEKKISRTLRRMNETQGGEPPRETDH